MIMSDIALMEIVNDPSQLSHCDISTFTDFVIDLCYQHYFDGVQSIELLKQLHKLKDSREYFNNQDHPSISDILCKIGNIILETSLSQLALPFFTEQYRIDKHYLGCHHPDLASVLFSIGQIHAQNNQLVEGKKYFTEAMSLLNTHKRKGQLYASLIYNIGLVNYQQSSYKEAFEQFEIAITEHLAAYGDFHPTVAQVRVKIGTLQLEIGKLCNAMDNFLEALVILRMVFGNNHSEVAQCLYAIALIHEAKAEHTESLNVLSQALSINENAQDIDDDDDDTLSLVILHKMSLIYQSIENVDKAMKIFENLKNLIKLKACDDEDEDKLLCSFGLCGNTDLPQAAAAA